MGGIVSGITDAVGLTNTDMEKKAGRNAAVNMAKANSLNKEQIEAAKEAIQFAKDQYADWSSVYGDIQENLGDYYKNLSAEKITVMGLQNQQMEYQQAVTAMEREAAQRGISGSGLEYAAKSSATFQNAEARALIRTNAPEAVAKAKQGFLALGLSQQPALLNNINNANAGLNNAYTAGVSANSGVAQSFLQQQTTAASNNQDAMGDLIGIGLGFL